MSFEWTNTEMFGLTLTCLIYVLACQVQKKWKYPVLNPLILTFLTIDVVLLLTGIPLENYQKGGNLIHSMLTPVTCILAVSVYRRRALLKEKWISILAGCAVGTVTAAVSTAVLCKLFQVEEEMTMTMLPKTVTGPFAIAISEIIGGVPSVTIACVSMTGITGIVLAPYIMKLLRARDSTAIGVCLGTSCHALGTVRAMEIGEEEGAMASLAMVCSGLVLLTIVPFITRYM